MKDLKINNTSVGTKITKENKGKIIKIANNFGMNQNQLLQSLLLFLLKCFDKHTDISEENNTLLKCYLNYINSKKKSFIPIGGVNKGIFFIEKGKGIKPQLISIYKDCNGKLTESYNVDEIMEDVLSSLDPVIIDVIKGEKKVNKEFSLLNTLHNMVMQNQYPKKIINEKIENNYNNDNKTISLVTRITKEGKGKIIKIANNFGMNQYQLLQSLLLFLLKSFDKHTDISEENDTLLKCYLNYINSQKESFIPISISVSKYKSINKGIFFIEKGKGIKPQLISIYKDCKGKLTKSNNVDKIMEDVLFLLDPVIVGAIKRERKKNKNFSLLSTLHNMVMSNQDEEKTIHEEINELFSEEINEIFDDLTIETFEETKDVYYKRKHAKGIDGVISYTPEARNETNTLNTERKTRAAQFIYG